MDIDTTIRELDQVLHYRGREGLVEAAARAPKLLKQDRYRQADDAHKSLANDIEAAIARLPEDLQKAANGILPIDKPNAFLNARQSSIGIGKYSPVAVQWHRTAVLGRVAGELIKVYTATPPSYRILDLDINVWEYDYTVKIGVGPTTYTRNIEFRWTLESLVSDLRWFAFSYRTPRRLKLRHLHRPCGPGDGGDIFRQHLPPAREWGWDWIPGALDSDAVPSYLLRLSDTPPAGAPIGLLVRLTFDKANKVERRFDYVPTVPLKRLSLSFPYGRAGKRNCRELDDATNAVLREFTLKQLTVTENYGEDYEKHYVGVGGHAGNDARFVDGDYITTQTIERFRVRSPRVGRRYCLEW